MNWKFILAGLVYSIAFAVLMLFCKQNEFSEIIVHFALCFVAYAYLVYARKDFSLRYLIVLGVSLRIFSVFLFPNLSDDVYRFFWDGHLWTSGIHPFDFTPSQLMESGKISQELKEIYPLLNSKDYYTIYPPVLQFIFFITSWLAKSIGGTAIFMKVIYLLVDVFALWGLVKILDYFKKDRKSAMVYFLNPLIITELVGNIHAEVLMVATLIWMTYFLVVQKYWQAGIFFALAIASKILPLLLGPMLLFYLIKKKAWIPFFASASLVVVVSFSIMLLGSDIAHLLDSIDLYFRSFEFNASSYYLARWIGYFRKGYNMIGVVGPLLAMVSLILILAKSFKVFKSPSKDLLVGSIPVLFLIYLLFSTTIHPWYLAVPIAFVVFNSRYILLVTLWSFLIMLSYSAYDTNPVQEHTSILVLEYGILLLVAIYGSMRKKMIS